MISRADFPSKDAFLDKFGEALSNGSTSPQAAEFMLLASTVRDWTEDAQKLFDSRVRIEKLLNLNPVQPGPGSWSNALQSVLGLGQYVAPVIRNARLQGGIAGMVLAAATTYFAVRTGPPDDVAKTQDLPKKVEEAINKLDSLPQRVVSEMEKSDALADRIAKKVKGN